MQDPTDPTQIDDWPARQAAAAVPFKVVNGRPVNPTAPTGTPTGWGGLKHWGELHAADPIVTADTPEHGRLLLLIERSDFPRRWALPGGCVDPGETPRLAAIREMEEEAKVTLDMLAAVWPAAYNSVAWKMLPARVVPDPRATDEAWIATTPVCAHLGTVSAADLPIPAGGDGALQAAWVPAGSYATLQAYLADSHGAEVFEAHRELLRELLDGGAR